MQLHQLTALQQSAALRRGEVSAAELTAHHLRRTEDLGHRVGAFITVMAEEAMSAAHDIDRRLREGRAPSSPLFGVTAPIKDLDQVAGVRCTYGSALYANNVAESDAAFVTKMRAAGLIITGKTNTPEFGFPCYTEGAIAPPARTPWDLTRSAGGSSGGAAAAVATGLCAVAQGSDGGGSIRIPAAVTGLVGIKPARGRIGWSPAVDELGELAVLGPLARTVADAAALLDVMAGGSVGDPFHCGPAGSFLAAAGRDPGRLRIGRYSRPVVADTVVDPYCLQAYEAASTMLADLGHDVVDVQRPFGPDAVSAFEAVWAGGAAAIDLPPDSLGRVQPLTRWLIERGGSYGAADSHRAVRTMRMLARDAVEATAGFDLVLTPALAQLPAAVGGLRDDADPAADFEAQKAFTPFTSPYNVTGQPALTLPVGWTESGLPVAVQLVARPRDEWTMISVAASLEALVADRPAHGLW